MWHGCLSFVSVICYQVEVSATCQSLVACVCVCVCVGGWLGGCVCMGSWVGVCSLECDQVQQKPTYDE